MKVRKVNIYIAFCTIINTFVVNSKIDSYLISILLLTQVTTGIGIIALAIIGFLLYIYIFDGIDRRVRLLESNQSSICTAVCIANTSTPSSFSHYQKKIKVLQILIFSSIVLK